MWQVKFYYKIMNKKKNEQEKKNLYEICVAERKHENFFIIIDNPWLSVSITIDWSLVIDKERNKDAYIYNIEKIDGWQILRLLIRNGKKKKLD